MILRGSNTLMILTDPMRVEPIAAWQNNCKTEQLCEEDWLCSLLFASETEQQKKKTR